jgi:glycine hydroxymethyltransferase
MKPSGIRFGTPAMTTRGLSISQMKQVAEWMTDSMEIIRDRGNNDESLYQSKKLRAIGREIAQMLKEYPIPGLEQDSKKK